MILMQHQIDSLKLVLATVAASIIFGFYLTRLLFKSYTKIGCNHTDTSTHPSASKSDVCYPNLI